MTSSIGIDPGLSGAFALIDPDESWWTTTLPYRGNQLDMRRWVGNSLLMPEDSTVVIEMQFGRGKGTKTLYGNYGQLLGGLRLAGFDPIEVTPKKWKDYFGLDSTKEKSVALAAEMFDGAAGLTHDEAEALLLAEYGRQVHA